jgi:N6-adenosine-specific RNA methylase IME4
MTPLHQAEGAEVQGVPFSVLVADCPWSFNDSLPGEGIRGAAKKYEVQSVDFLKAFPLPPLADDALLFFWRVAAMQEEALAVVRAWGFTVKSELVWVKKTTTGKRHFGMGRYVRAEHEVCLIATRGHGNRLIRSKSVRSVLDAPTGVHSRKPDAFYDLVEQLAPGPYVELFARRQRKGWTCFGNELGRVA